jgi:CHAT domain-containing protein
MPDWARFHEAFAAGLPNAGRLAQFRKVNGWLDLAPPEAALALDTELSASDARTLYQDLIVLNLKMQREAGMPVGPESGPALEQLFAEVQQGTASEERKRLAARFSVLYQLGGILLQKDPTLSQGPSPADLAKSKLEQATTEIFQRMEAAASQTTPGTVTPASIQTIENGLGDAKALIAATPPDNQGLPYLFYMTGSGSRMLAHCYAITGRNEDALKTLEAAADSFEKAGEPQQVEDCRSRARNLRQQLSIDLDAAAAESMATLEAAAASGDHWEHVKALMQLASIAGTAADTFEASERAEAAAKELSDLGYRDPGACGAEAAVDSWIAASTGTLQGVPLLGRISQVGTWYDEILGARFAAMIRKDAAAANALNALQVEVQKLCASLREEANQAQAASRREFESYFLPPRQDSAAQAPPSPDFETLLDRMRAVDAALAKIRETCNERAAAHEGMDDLLDAVGKLEAEADTLNSPEYEAKARLERAYILYHLGRGADLGPVAREARRRLLAGRAPGLSSFVESHLRYLYLDSLKREAVACIMTGDFEGSLKLCEDTVRDFEIERYRVNSEYRQSALLSYVAEFYTWAAFSAFKLKRWDNMLEAIDLIKARAAIRSRLLPDAPERLNANLLREFDEAGAAAVREPANEALKAKRRQIWDLLSIARGQSGANGEAPVLTVAALQSGLAEDEALIGYFWLAGSVILAVAVDRERFVPQRISLETAQLESLKEFVAFVQKLRTSQKMDRAVAALGEILFPGFLRDFVRSKQRIIFSPHHSLHLFPFHAARWDAGDFVGTKFAVRYVPNFSSVILPWAQQLENRVLAVGINQFAGTLALPLSNVEDDAVAVEGCYRRNGASVLTLLGTAATRERIEALRRDGTMATFRCIHLGTHGRSVFENPAQPLESCLMMQDGALDAMDIANLQLKADLVVLSACHSGERAIELRDLGELPGDDIFGLQAALFRSGVRSVLGTLWLVETTSSSPITRAFHKHHAEGKPAEVALQLAVKDYLANAKEKQRGVFYWAPYFISTLGSTPKGDTWQN